MIDELFAVSRGKCPAFASGFLAQFQDIGRAQRIICQLAATSLLVASAYTATSARGTGGLTVVHGVWRSGVKYNKARMRVIAASPSARVEKYLNTISATSGHQWYQPTYDKQTQIHTDTRRERPRYIKTSVYIKTLA